MNRALFTLFAISTMCVFCKTTHAESLLGNSSVELRTPLTISENVPMDFGTITVAASGDAIRLRPNNNITTTNGSISSGGQTSGRFRVDGTPDSSVSYSFNAGNFLSGPGTDIPIGDFVINRSNPFTINSDGRRFFRVGATMFPSAGQSGGLYSGTYILTINYE